MPENELPDGLILAALARAELQTLRMNAPGVLVANVAEHLGLRRGPGAARRLHPRLRALAAGGLVEALTSQGRRLYALTAQGQRSARRTRYRGALPQHRRWREARETAKERISGYRSDVRALLREAAAALATDTTDSEAWFALGEKLERACSRLASATHCLHEWAEPDDATADIDKSKRWMRRDVTLWRS